MVGGRRADRHCASKAAVSSWQALNRRLFLLTSPRAFSSMGSVRASSSRAQASRRSSCRLRFGGGATFTLWLALRARGRAIVVIASRDGDAAAADDGDASEAEDAPGESAAASKMSAKALGRIVFRAAIANGSPAPQQACDNTDSRARRGTIDEPRSAQRSLLRGVGVADRGSLVVAGDMY